MYEPIMFAVKDTDKYVFNADEIKVEAKTGAIRRLIDYRKPVPTQYNTTKVPGNAWYFPRVRYRMDEYEEHPTQKPESLMRRIIEASSRPGDVVLDPFSGTFTTCAVAQKLGRRSIGVECEASYVEIGLRRLGIAATFQGKALEPPKKTFSAARHLRKRQTSGDFSRRCDGDDRTSFHPGHFTHSQKSLRQLRRRDLLSESAYRLFEHQNEGGFKRIEVTSFVR